MTPETQTSTYDRTARGTAIFVGLMFLTATVTFAVGDALVLDALAPAEAGSATSGLALGVALQSVCAIAVAALGVALLRPLARFDRGMAYGHFALRALEGVVIVAIGVYMLTTATLVNYEPIVYLFTGTAGLMFAHVLLRSGLAPRGLAQLGIVGYVAILAVLPVELLGIASLDTLPGMLLYVPGGLFELFLPVLLIARGFRRTDTSTVRAPDEQQPALAHA